MKRYPAIAIRNAPDPEIVAALVDDFAPTAIEPRDADVRVFFASAADRDAARRALEPAHDIEALEVSDEDWARRSQQNLEPVTVGALTILPGPPAPRTPHLAPRTPHPAPRTSHPAPCHQIVISPSMGFGTGHHATTRLCVDALQAVGVAGAEVLDAGTGSGILAIAAARLGAARAVGIDVDPDAICSARENLELNADLRDRVTFARVDVTIDPLPPADVVTANLTAALLVRTAAALVAATRNGGTLIVSGLLADERDEVWTAFAGSTMMVWEREEDGWVGLAMKRR